VTLSGAGGKVHGTGSSEHIKVVIGFRDSSKNWVGGEPVVIWSGVPGTSFVPWSGTTAVINAPSTCGTYDVWVHAVPTFSEATAIQSFKDAKPTTTDQVQNDSHGSFTVPCTYGMIINSCNISDTTPDPGQSVTLSGAGGQVHGASSSDLIKVVIGFRDSSRNWVGGEPVVIWSGVPGTSFVPWSRTTAVINAPSTCGTYDVWVHAVSTFSEATAIQNFKNAKPTTTDQVQNDSHGSFTVSFTPPPTLGITITSCSISDTTPDPGQSVTLSGAGGKVHGTGSSEHIKVVIGFRDSSKNWVGGEPVVIWSGVPGTSFVPWSGTTAVINAPSTCGTYDVWVHAVSTFSEATAIQNFKNAKPTTTDQVQNDSRGSLTVLCTHTLTVSSSAGGSVTTPGQGPFQYDHGSSVPVVATPAANYHFVNWTGTAVDVGKVADPSAASTTVTVDADYTLQANFAKNIESPIVSTLSATYVDQTSARLRGRIEDDGGEACNYTFSYWGDDVLHPTPPWSSETIQTGDVFYLDVTDLKPGYVYYYQAYAKNSAGGSEGSSDSFKTTTQQKWFFVHITDPHIGYYYFEKENTDRTTRHLAAMVNYINNMLSKPDFVLVTGDIVDYACEGTGQAGDRVYTTCSNHYGRFAESMKRLVVPYMVVPGNHDRAANTFPFYETTCDNDLTCYTQHFQTQHVFPWKGIQFIGLDSGDGNCRGDGLTDYQFSLLKGLWDQYPEMAKIVFMHHPGVDLDDWCGGPCGCGPQSIGRIQGQVNGETITDVRII
jgi:hypothetical protein